MEAPPLNADALGDTGHLKAFVKEGRELILEANGGSKEENDREFSNLLRENGCAFF
jgi:hypothetical protein